jgi:hypothetical protein
MGQHERTVTCTELNVEVAAFLDTMKCRAVDGYRVAPDGDTANDYCCPF